MTPVDSEQLLIGCLDLTKILTYIGLKYQKKKTEPLRVSWTEKVWEPLKKPMDVYQDMDGYVCFTFSALDLSELSNFSTMNSYCFSKSIKFILK